MDGGMIDIPGYARVIRRYFRLQRPSDVGRVPQLQRTLGGSLAQRCQLPRRYSVGLAHVRDERALERSTGDALDRNHTGWCAGRRRHPKIHAYRIILARLSRTLKSARTVGRLLIDFRRAIADSPAEVCPQFTHSSVRELGS